MKRRRVFVLPLIKMIVNCRSPPPRHFLRLIATVRRYPISVIILKRATLLSKNTKQRPWPALEFLDPESVESATIMPPRYTFGCILSQKPFFIMFFLILNSHHAFFDCIVLYRLVLMVIPLVITSPNCKFCLFLFFQILIYSVALLLMRAAGSNKLVLTL